MQQAPLARLAALFTVLALSTGTAHAQSQSGAAASGETTATDAQAETGAETGTEAAQPPQDAAPALTAETVLVTVDDTSVTLGELIAVRQSLPEQFQQLPDEVLMKVLIEQIVDQQMLANAGVTKGLRNSRLVQLALRNQERAVLADAYMAHAMVEGVTEDTLKAAYTEQYVNAEPVPEIRVGHILVADEDAALALKTELDAGAEFAAIASQHGTDGTAARGGDMGWLADGDYVPEFIEAAFAMEEGTISDPVQSPFGWHLIRLEAKRNRPVPAFEDVQAQLIGVLTEQVQTGLLQKLRSEAQIEVLPAAAEAAALRNDSLLFE